MSQVVFPDLVDNVDTGTTLAIKLNAFRDALMSGLSGPARPDATQAGGYWIDTSSEGTENKWRFKLWTGVLEVTLMEISTTTGVVSMGGTSNLFDITKVSDDAFGPVLNFIKERIADNKQTKAGDTLGVIAFNGHNNISGGGALRIESASMHVSALEDFTDDESGSKVEFKVIREGTNTEEVPLTITSRRVELSDNAVLSKSLEFERMDTIPLTANVNSLVGVTGFLLLEPDADDIEIRGIEYSLLRNNKITIANNSAFELLLIHDSGDAAADDRMLLPEGVDLKLKPSMAITLFHNGTAWAVLGGAGVGGGGGAGLIVADMDALDAIPVDERIDGMVVTVLANEYGARQDFQWFQGISAFTPKDDILRFADATARNAYANTYRRDGVLAFQVDENMLYVIVNGTQWLGLGFRRATVTTAGPTITPALVMGQEIEIEPATDNEAYALTAPAIAGMRICISNLGVANAALISGIKGYPSIRLAVGKSLWAFASYGIWHLMNEDLGIVELAAQTLAADANITMVNTARQVVRLQSNNNTARTASLVAPVGNQKEVFVSGNSDDYPVMVNGIYLTTEKTLHFIAVNGAWKMVQGA